MQNTDANEPQDGAQQYLEPADTREPTQYQLERRHQVFMLYVNGESQRSIAKKLSITGHTVRTDLKAESDLRAQDLADGRETEIARAVAFYEGIKARAIEKSDISTGILKQLGAGEARTLNDRYLGDAIAAQARIDRLMGSESVVKISLGLEPLLQSLDSDLPE
jgi:hypothetical protein